MRNTQQSVKTDPLLTAFDLADINRMKIRLLREPFLAHAGLLAVFSDRVAKDLEMWSVPGHKFLAKQDGNPRNTPNMGLFARCARPMQQSDPSGLRRGGEEHI